MAENNTNGQQKEPWTIPGMTKMMIPDIHNVREYIKFWIRLFPASKRDYFLFFITLLDVVLLEVNNTFKVFLNPYFISGVVIFDFLVIFIWFLDFRKRYKNHENKLEYISINWYEIVGILPFSVLRPFLFLRAVKMGIAAFKLANANIDPDKLKTREVYIKFSEVFIDTISDKVFLQSIDRVRDVMRRLEYDKLVDTIFTSYEKEIQSSVREAVYQKTSLKDLTRLPFFNMIESKLSSEITSSMKDLMKSEIIAEVVRTITTEILDQMEKRVTMMDAERITRQEFSLADEKDSP